MIDLEHAQALFAELTGILEDASVIAAEAQAVTDVGAGRNACDRLIDVLEDCSRRLQHLRTVLR